MRTLTIQCAGFLGEPFTIVHDSENQFMRVENVGNNVWLVQTKLLGERKPQIARLSATEASIWARIGHNMGLTRIQS